ncbi:MAG TPA: MarR family transcriptional regulator, partial [Rhizobiaceae bacterium]|nr:MarR family transcriptional regulator [Rhizobiaceae bacterium]
MKNNLGLVGVAVDPAPTGDVKALYLESLTLVERLHRRLLDVIKD